MFGLASQWVSGVASPYVHCLVKDLLGIPAELEIYDMLAVGHPAVEARPKLLRERSEMVGYDCCGPDAFRSDEEVRDFVRKAQLTMASQRGRPTPAAGLPRSCPAVYRRGYPECRMKRTGCHPRQQEAER